MSAASAVAPSVVAQPEVMTVEAFVSGAVAALEQAASELPRSELRDLLQRGPDGVRELTIYLPEQLARDLALHCQNHDLDMSRLVARALEQYLSAAGAKSGERKLRALARTLLDELAQRARAFWLARRDTWSSSAQPSAS